MRERKPYIEIEEDMEEMLKGKKTKFYSIDNITDGKVYYIAKTLKEAQAKLKLALQREDTKGKNVRIAKNINKRRAFYYYYCSPIIRKEAQING